MVRSSRSIEKFIWCRSVWLSSSALVPVLAELRYASLSEEEESWSGFRHVSSTASPSHTLLTADLVLYFFLP